MLNRIEALLHAAVVVTIVGGGTYATMANAAELCSKTRVVGYGYGWDEYGAELFAIRSWRNEAGYIVGSSRMPEWESADSRVIHGCESLTRPRWGWRGNAEIVGRALGPKNGTFLCRVSAMPCWSRQLSSGSNDSSKYSGWRPEAYELETEVVRAATFASSLR